MFGFLGGNGAVKTTMLRMVLDILSPDAARIAVLGRVFRSSLLAAGQRASLARLVGLMPARREPLPSRSFAPIFCAAQHNA